MRVSVRRSSLCLHFGLWVVVCLTIGFCVFRSRRSVRLSIGESMCLCVNMHVPRSACMSICLCL